MLGWCIRVFILAALVVALGHFVLEHFNEHLNQPKIHQYDETYKKILNVLNTPYKEIPEPTVARTIPPPPIETIVPSQSIIPPDTTSIDQLPPYEEQNMEESLKDFIGNIT